jgi:hypothetical protein
MTSALTRHMIAAASGLALALAASGAFAQHDRYEAPYHGAYDYPARTATPQIDRVFAEHARRIHWGLRSGALTRIEARYLQRQQREILRTKQRALHDGHVSGDERRELRALQARAEHDIDRALRNARHDPRDGRYYGRG